MFSCRWSPYSVFHCCSFCGWVENSLTLTPRLQQYFAFIGLETKCSMHRSTFKRCYVTKQYPKSEKTQTAYRRFPFVCARRVPLFPPLLFFRFFSGLVFTMSMGMDSRCEAHVSFWRAAVFNPGLPITALFHHETAQWNFGIASSAATGWFWVPNACLIVFRFVFSGAGLRLPKGATFPQKKMFQGPQRWALVDCLPEPWWDENRCDMMWN